MPPWTAGVRLGPYEMVSPIGAGGMGEVWKARDTRLDRVVAVKRIDAEHAERFQREARAMAALNHPHICQIYDVGADYLVMEYIEGAPLKGPLPAEEAIRLAVQMASAIEEAHSRGIIHRDLKPGNVLVNTKGATKLLDFGLAKRLEPDPPGDAFSTITGGLTEAGAVIGTVAYMSPEQVQGQVLDARSDIFSFGLVLYEMVSGRRAFARETKFATMSAIVRDEHSPIQAPAALERIIRRCLAKQPSARYQTMIEVKTELEKAEVKAGEQQPSIAVLPFANMSSDPDDEYFSDGLAEEIINELARIPGLKVIARTSSFAFKGQNTDVRRIAEALGVANILEGSVRRSGGRIRVTLQLITAWDGSHLWSWRYDREMADVFAIQDEIAQAIAAALQLKLAGRPAEARRYTPKLPAYESLLRGRHHLFKFTSAAWARAGKCFERAAALDPGYAQPHADLGLGYLMLGVNGIRPLQEVVLRVRAEAQKALDLDPSEPGPHFLLGSVSAAHDYNWKEAAEQFRVAMSAAPVAIGARWAYASLYLQPFGRFQEAVAEMEREVEQDPLNVAWRAVLANHLTHAGMYDRAIEEGRKALEIDESFWTPYFVLAETYTAAGKFDEAAAAAERAHRIVPWNSMPAGWLAGTLVRIGDTRRAAEIVRKMGDSPTPVMGRALYHLLCSETDEAADWYERAIEQREPFALIFASAPCNQVLRESRRWPKLAKMMNLDS